MNTSTSEAGGCHYAGKALCSSRTRAPRNTEWGRLLAARKQTGKVDVVGARFRFHVPLSARTAAAVFFLSLHYFLIKRCL